MIDRAAMRRRYVEGWRPGMSVSVEVGTLAAMLDELDRLHAERMAAQDLMALIDRAQSHVHALEQEATRLQTLLRQQEGAR